MSRVISENDVIQHMEVPTAKGIFIVGCFERRVTLLSQQVRALNLVYALRSQKRLNQGSRVAVIGGGAAGMTAAAAAARVGCEVTLLERRDALLPLLRGNTTRWIHPHIYDWPREGTERSEAELPLLTWTAAPARDVVVQLEQQWKTLHERSRIQTYLNVESVNMPSEGRGAPHTVTWNSPGFKEGQFDAVLLTVGFGLEGKVEGIQWSSYWADNHLHQISLEGSARYLISGCGDGGLIDLLRVRLRDFRHEDILREFLSAPSLTALKSELLEIEEHARSPGVDSNACLFERYKGLKIPELDQAITSRLRGNVVVVLNGLEPRPLGLQSSILNRLLVARLLALGHVRYRSGRFTATRIGEQYEARFDTGKPERFDHIVCRHGPHPSALQEEFKSIWERSDALRAMSALDQTRAPIWSSGFFDVPPDIVGEVRSTIPDPLPSQEAVTKIVAPAAARTVQETALTAAPKFLLAASPGGAGAQCVGLVVASPVSEIIGVPVQSAVSSPAQAGNTRGVKAAAQPLSGLGLLVGIGVLWALWKGVLPTAPVKSAPVSSSPTSSASKVVRTPTNLNPSVGTRSNRSNIEDSGGLERVAQGGSKAMSRRAAESVAPKSAAEGGSPDVVLANARVDNVQQLRELRGVRLVPMVNGERLTLDSSPSNVYGFISPLPDFNYGQSVVGQAQDTRGRSVEVHKLADGQLHLVGYVWDVESRALATGRPVKVSFLPHPSGQSQNLVSVPFNRLRSVKIQDGQGPLVMDLDLGSSTSL